MAWLTWLRVAQQVVVAPAVPLGALRAAVIRVCSVHMTAARVSQHRLLLVLLLLHLALCHAGSWIGAPMASTSTLVHPASFSLCLPCTPASSATS